MGVAEMRTMHTNLITLFNTISLIHVFLVRSFKNYEGAALKYNCVMMITNL